MDFNDFTNFDYLPDLPRTPPGSLLDPPWLPPGPPRCAGTPFFAQETTIKRGWLIELAQKPYFQKDWGR